MKDIMLKIVGRQVAFDSEESQLEFMTEGKYYVRGDSVYLSYDESEFSGMEGCTTSLKITGDHIKMKRYGESISLDTEIVFEKGKRFKGYYDTPYGSVKMEVLTNDVINKIEKSEGRGTLNIDYQISLKGLSESRSILDIEII
jgi:uncharacterized beta-barrel protein YwiB (DUF1934 family)